MRRHVIRAVASIVALVGTAACTDVPPPDQVANSSAGRMETGEDGGFRAELDGVAVEGAAGAAPRGVEVQVGLMERESPDGDAEIVAGVDVVLGDDLQPGAPVTVQFELEEQPSESVAYAVLRTSSNEDDYVFVEHEIVNGRVVVVSEHLSSFWLVRFDPRTWLNELTQQIEYVLGLQYPEPDCARTNAGHSPDLDEVYFVAEGPGLGAIHLCADRLSNEDLSMQFYSNGPVAWEIAANPPSPSAVPIVQLRLGDIFATAGYRLANSHPQGKVLLTPGAQTSFSASDTHLPVRYSGEVDALWGGVALGVEAALGVAGLGQSDTWERLSKVADLQDAVSCMSGTVTAGLHPQVGATVSAAVTCVGRLIEDNLSLTDKLLQFRLGVVSSVVMHAPRTFLSALITKHTDTFSVELQSVQRPEQSSLRQSEETSAGFVTADGQITCGMNDYSDYQRVECILEELDVTPEPLIVGACEPLPGWPSTGQQAKPRGVAMHIAEAGVQTGWFCPNEPIYSSQTGNLGTAWQLADDPVLPGPFGDPPYPDRAVLEEGVTLTQGDLRCTPEGGGVTCIHDVTGHGFFVSPTQYSAIQDQ